MRNFLKASEECDYHLYISVQFFKYLPKCNRNHQEIPLNAMLPHPSHQLRDGGDDDDDDDEKNCQLSNIPQTWNYGEFGVKES